LAVTEPVSFKIILDALKATQVGLKPQLKPIKKAAPPSKRKNGKMRLGKARLPLLKKE
jgi:hypothetical protein